MRNPRLPLTLTLLFMLACKATPALREPCDSTWTAYPEHGSSEVYYRTAIEVTLSERAQVTLELHGPIGRVDGSIITSDDGRNLVFTPDEPLQPSSDYALELDELDGNCLGGTSSFSTSATGTPVDIDEIANQNTAYSVTLQSGRWSEPENGLQRAIALATDASLLLSLTSADNWVAQFLDERPVSGQDMCSATHGAWVADSSQNPDFELQTTIPLSVSLDAVTLSIYSMAGTFSPDGGAIDGLVMEGMADFSNLPPAQLDLVCGSSPPCEACNNGSLNCAGFRVDRMTASGTDGGLIARSGADVNHDDSCALAIVGQHDDSTGTGYRVYADRWYIFVDSGDSVSFELGDYSNSAQWVDAVGDHENPAEYYPSLASRLFWIWNDADDEPSHFCHLAWAANATPPNPEDLGAGCDGLAWVTLLR